MKRKVQMFRKLRTANFLKLQADGNAVRIGFAGRIARIARVHQYGLKDRAENGAPEVRYDKREVLGFTDADVDLIRDGLLAYFSQQKVI